MYAELIVEAVDWLIARLKKFFWVFVGALAMTIFRHTSVSIHWTWK